MQLLFLDISKGCDFSAETLISTDLKVKTASFDISADPQLINIFLFLPLPITSLISDIDISGRLDQIIDLHLRLSHILVTYLTSLLASPRSFPVEDATARIKSRFLPDVNRHSRLIMSLGVLEASALSSVCEVIGRNTSVTLT